MSHQSAETPSPEALMEQLQVMSNASHAVVHPGCTLGAECELAQELFAFGDDVAAISLAHGAEQERARLLELRAHATTAYQILEALRLSVEWELAPPIMDLIARTTPKLRAALDAKP